MKRTLLSFLFISMMLVIGQAQAPRMVLVEEFTQASCFPCAIQNPDFNELLFANLDIAVPIKYQTSWPGNDPMNSHNPTEVQTRVDYYQVQGVPAAIVGGTEQPIDPAGFWYDGAPANVTQEILDAQAAMGSPISMTLDHFVLASLDSLFVEYTITNEMMEAIALDESSFHIYLLEDELAFGSAPGTNAETDFYQVFRKELQMSTMTITLEPGESLSGSLVAEVPDYIYSLNEISVVAFLQDNATSFVTQSAFSAPKTIVGHPDFALTNMAMPDSDNLCDANFSNPVVTVSNLANEAYNGFSVSMLVNGTSVETITDNDPIPAGGSRDISFSGFLIESVMTNVQFELESTDDIGQLNNTSKVVDVLRLEKTPVEAFNYDFQNGFANADPEDMVADSPDRVSFVFKIVTSQAVGGGNVGAYEEGGVAGQSMIINTFFWDPVFAETSSANTLITKKLNVPNETMVLRFDHAHRQLGNSTDELSIEISTDCFDTSETLWSASGADLATTAAGDGVNFLVPTADQWTTTEVSLGDYAGESVSMRWNIEVGGGDMIYIDNIVTEFISNTEDEIISDIAVYPNPSSGQVTIDSDYEIFDLILINELGQKVQHLPSDNRVLDLGYFQNGMYYLDIIHEKGNTRKKIQLVK